MSGFAAIVLAGGSGRRLGGEAKPERPVGGVPMLNRVLGAVTDADALVVVGPPRLAPLLPADARLTMEEPPGGGPVAALGAGLALLDPGPEIVALLATDLPFLTSSTVTLLRRAVDASGATGAVLTTRLLHSLVRDGLKRGIVTLCIGGGQGIALAVEIL